MSVALFDSFTCRAEVCTMRQGQRLPDPYRHSYLTYRWDEILGIGTFPDMVHDEPVAPSISVYRYANPQALMHLGPAQGVRNG
jgi:hypothetical protein